MLRMEDEEEGQARWRRRVLVAGEARLFTGWHANPHLSLVADTSVNFKPDSLWGEAVPRLCSAMPVAGVDASSYQARNRLSESVLSDLEPRDDVASPLTDERE